MEMTVTETARHLPAACAVCMGHMGPFCDTQVDLGAVEDQNGFGWLYVCRKCVGTMAALFGHITPEEAEELRAEIETGKQYAALTEDLLREANQNKVVRVSELQELGLLTFPESPSETPEEPDEPRLAHTYSGWAPPGTPADAA